MKIICRKKYSCFYNRIMDIKWIYIQPICSRYKAEKKRLWKTCRECVYVLPLKAVLNAKDN